MSAPGCVTFRPLQKNTEDAHTRTQTNTNETGEETGRSWRPCVLRSLGWVVGGNDPPLLRPRRWQLVACHPCPKLSWSHLLHPAPCRELSRPPLTLAHRCAGAALLNAGEERERERERGVPESALCEEPATACCCNQVDCAWFQHRFSCVQHV